MRELTFEEIDSISGGRISLSGLDYVGLGMGMIGLGLGIAAAPIGILGTAVAAGLCFGGGINVGTGAYSFYSSY